MKRYKEATVKDLTRLLGENVRLHRNIMGWSQELLAEKINVSKNTIHEIETGRKFVRAQSFVELANIFHIEPYKLILPEYVQNYNSAKDVIEYAGYASDALKNLLDDFLKKNNVK